MEILSDSIPETAEQLTVQLVSVEPQLTQRLHPGAQQLQLVIAENDNPGGVFEFGTNTLPSYIVQVGK